MPRLCTKGAIKGLRYLLDNSWDRSMSLMERSMKRTRIWYMEYDALASSMEFLGAINRAIYRSECMKSWSAGSPMDHWVGKLLHAVNPTEIIEMIIDRKRLYTKSSMESLNNWIFTHCIFELEENSTLWVHLGDEQRADESFQISHRGGIFKLTRVARGRQGKRRSGKW